MTGLKEEGCPAVKRTLLRIGTIHDGSLLAASGDRARIAPSSNLGLTLHLSPVTRSEERKNHEDEPILAGVEAMFQDKDNIERLDEQEQPPSAP
ncbi:hypothetical protein FOMPIDRAFT_1055141 [Fomitopsis schrenkii]|uniref:Uncharacterized protein n=1 Tax=Fomitopsis schrenkii TaxID=2126942 RepID=S8DLF0_FOMSC|nr:hypothetical protein FOMPIDRAFT_1055141 [Fomitopsis schrenkii]